MEFKQPPNLTNDHRDGYENGKNAKGFRLTKQFCMCSVLFSTPGSLLLLYDKKMIFLFFLKEKFTNILQIENDGIRGLEFETNYMNENLFFQVTVLLWSPSWLLKLPNISLSLLNNRSKATKDSERRWTELRQYIEPDNHISVPGPSEDSIYKKPSIKVCLHFFMYKQFSPCLALLYFTLLYFIFLINAKISRIKDKSNRIKLLNIIFFVFFTRYILHFVIIRIPKEKL